MTLLLAMLLPVAAGLGAGRLVRGATAYPAAAAVVLTGFALSVALVTGLLLGLAAYLGTVQLVPVIHPADWSADVLRGHLPLPEAAAVAAGVLVAVLLVRAVVHAVRVVGARRPSGRGLTVVEDDAVIAHAVAGRIVVSTGLLRRLTGPQRRALLAHEEAHVRHRHHLYVQLTRLAVRANPLLAPVERAVRAAVERWADAEAVRAVGDPVVVAHALGVAALARPATSYRTLGAAGGDDVVGRVRDLLEPAPRRPHRLVVIGLCAFSLWAGLLVVAVWAHGIVELSELVS